MVVAAEEADAPRETCEGRRVVAEKKEQLSIVLVFLLLICMSITVTTAVVILVPTGI